MCSVQCTVYTVHFILYTVHCTLYIVQYTVYIVQCIYGAYNCVYLQCTLLYFRVAEKSRFAPAPAPAPINRPSITLGTPSWILIQYEIDIFLSSSLNNHWNIKIWRHLKEKNNVFRVTTNKKDRRRKL